MTGQEIKRDWRAEEEEHRRMVGDQMRDAGGVLLNDLNRFDFVDQNGVHRAGDLRDIGRGVGMGGLGQPHGRW